MPVSFLGTSYFLKSSVLSPYLGGQMQRLPYVEQVFNQLPGAARPLVIGNHDHKPTLELSWDSISHFAELRDGPQNQLNTLCHYPMITWNHARRGALQLASGLRVHPTLRTRSSVGCRRHYGRMPLEPLNRRDHSETFR